MRKTLRVLLASGASVLLALAVFAHAVIAQSDKADVSITVLPGCTPVGAMSLEALSGGSSSIAPGAVESGVTTFDWNLSLQINVLNAGCDQWSITAQVTDFQLEDDETKTFPGSTLRIARSSSIANSAFERWALSSQPDWVQSLPADLPIGNPVLPAPLAQTNGIFPNTSNTVSFSGTVSPYVGSSPLLASNAAAFGSPGNMSAYYRMRLFGLPTDLYLNPGLYTAELTISVQGPD